MKRRSESPQPSPSKRSSRIEAKESKTTPLSQRRRSTRAHTALSYVEGSDSSESFSEVVQEPRRSRRERPSTNNNADSDKNGESAKEEESKSPSPPRRRRKKKKVDVADEQTLDDLLEEEESREYSDNNSDLCEVCDEGGVLLCCDTCSRVYHLGCLTPPLQKVPEGNWSCPQCSGKKCEVCKTDKANSSLVYCNLCFDHYHLECLTPPLQTMPKKKTWFCSECIQDGDEPLKVDKIITRRIQNGIKEYYVKFVDRAYIHCKWMKEDRLRRIAGQKLRNFEKNFDSKIYHEDPSFHVRSEWMEMDRIIAKQSQGGVVSYLVKWHELQYDQSTWETASFISDKSKIKQFETFNDLKAAYKQIKKPKKPFEKYSTQPKFLHGGSLHDYQIEGINWVRFSWDQGRNVMLADEMGLGKTLQTVSCVASLADEITRGPFLVVAPLSTLRHWEREFSIWAPQLNIISYTGSQESRKIIKQYEFYFEKDSKRLPKFNVLLTSYELLIQDSSVLKPLLWELLVVDEAHRLKNNNSKLFQVLFTYKTNRRLLLTGTPLQNNLAELFHLLNFLSEEKFNSLNQFEEEFSAINKEDQIAKLHTLLKPHLLRRLKSDVMHTLLPKTELIVRVDLSTVQKEYYKAILTKNYEVLNRGARGPAQVSLLNIVSELQKCANHPYLFPNAEPPTGSPEEALKLLIQASGKMTLIDKMLDKLKRDGHRVLIFSQMTKVLDILEDYCYYKGFQYQRIDGSVSGEDRQHRIDAFNKSKDQYFIFLLSTRAGGLGINLATADTVIIYDSDWNPHNDIQALSRAHRIGQLKKVLIYRMVTRATVEERIIQISKSKMLLDHLVVHKMSSKGETTLKAGELDDILKFGAAELFNDEDSAQPLHYDDEAIEKLLDRNQQAVDEEKPAQQNDYLNSFKVASYTVKGENEASNPADWDKLLKDRWEKYRQEEMARNALGKGQRLRKQVRYTEADDGPKEEAETELYSPESSDDDAASDLENTSDPERPRRRWRRKKGLDLPLMEGEGKNLRVLGFNQTQRASFLKFVMYFGIGDPLWSHFTSPPDKGGVQLSSTLRFKDPKDMIDYGNLFLKHLDEPETSSEQFSDGVPKEGFSANEILIRIGKLRLIREIVHTEPFNIEDGGYTELHASWSSASSAWKKEHDKQLLIGILKHGYGKWPQIYTDSDLGILEPVTQELARLSESIPLPSANDKEGFEKALNENAHVISRFIRRRLSLLEGAINIQFQLRNRGKKLASENSGLNSGISATERTSAPSTYLTTAPSIQENKVAQEITVPKGGVANFEDFQHKWKETFQKIHSMRVEGQKAYNNEPSVGTQFRKELRVVDSLLLNLRDMLISPQPKKVDSSISVGERGPDSKVPVLQGNQENKDSS